MIVIQKRARTSAAGEWSIWSDTTDAAPYTNTDTVEYRVVKDTTIEELTDGSLVNDEWVGTGVFDKLMYAVNKNIQGEYNKGRLKGADYATVYLGSMQATLAQAVQFLLNEEQMTDKLLNSEKQREVMGAQKELYDRQREAFDDNKYQKLFEAQLNYNGMVFQDADAPDVLNIALQSHVNDVYNKIIGNGTSTMLADESLAAGVQEATEGPELV